MAGYKHLEILEAGVIKDNSIQEARKRGCISIRVKPGVQTVTYGVDTVLCDCFELENAVRVPGGISKLVNVTIINEKATATAAKDFKFLFSKNKQNLRTAEATPALRYDGSNKGDVDTAEIQAMEIVGMTEVDMSDNEMDLGDSGIVTTGGFGVTDSMHEVYVQAESSSQSIWCNITAGTATTVLKLNEWEVVFTFEYSE